jgi:hypothetical protein
MTYEILKHNLVTNFHRSVVRSASDTNHLDERVSFKSEIKYHLNYLISSQSLYGMIVIKSKNQERLIMICQTELSLRQITHNSILEVELGLRYISVA